MAKSDDFPGNTKKAPGWMTGVKRAPAELPEPNLKVSVKEMLAQKQLEQSGTASVEHEAESLAAKSQSSVDASKLVFTSGVIAEIQTELIRVSPFQPRLTFSETAIEELANSIASVGLVKPITVRPTADGFYELVGGERRWRAHKLLGRETITAHVRELDDAMAQILALTDNEGQETLTEYERGKSYSLILESKGERSIRSLGRRVGVNHSVISRCLLLMELPTEVRLILDEVPALIGGKWAKEFVQFSSTAPALLLKAVTAMKEQKWSQEHALRWLAKEIESQNQKNPTTKFSDTEISGIGRVRVDGKKVELRCERSVDAKRLAKHFERFLKEIDRSLITSE